MSELKVASCYEFEKVLRGKSNKLFYHKSEVDAAIAELKVENRSLKKDLYKTDHHNIQYLCSMYGCENVEAFHGEIKNIQTKLIATERALWLARAERAASWQIHFSLCHNHSIEREFSINGASMPCEGRATMRTAKDWAMIWKKVERLCLKKAEEYK